MAIDLFEIQNPKDLFFEIQSAIVEYHERPTSRLLLFLVFSLNHLREWIAGKSYEQIEKKIASKSALTPEEEFFCRLWSS